MKTIYASETILPTVGLQILIRQSDPFQGWTRTELCFVGESIRIGIRVHT